jgi:hypothetical protein
MLLILEKTFNQIKHICRQLCCVILKAIIELNYQCRHYGCLMVRVSYTADLLTN